MTSITVKQLDARMVEREAQVDARLDKLTKAIEGLTKGLAAQFATPAEVVTSIADAPSAKGRKAKASTKKAKVTLAKVAPTIVTMDEAKALVEAGESPWKVFVASTNPERLGEPVPFFRVQRAEAVKAGDVKARVSSREDNLALAAWLRERDLPANGEVWTQAKAGVRNVAKLKGLAKKQLASV